MISEKTTREINPAETSLEIEEFIRNTAHRLYKSKGIVIGLSGGIDSSVVASLSVRAVGAERVYGILMPERDSNPISREYGRMIAESLGIRYKEIDITTMLESFGVYEKRNAIVKKLFPGILQPYKFRLSLPQNLLNRNRLNIYHIEVLLRNGSVMSKRLGHDDYLELMAANDIKQRIRMIRLYYEAERRHYIVCGTTNHTELVLGFYVKYGDGGVDIEPIAHLYKNEVYQLGTYLGVPKEILSRTPSPDTYSYEVSDEDFFFCLSYDVVDQILYAIEHDIPKDKVEQVIGLNANQVNRAWKDLNRKRELAEHLMQNPPSLVSKYYVHHCESGQQSKRKQKPSQ